jgi:NAD(P)H-dependent FMN reductase
MKLLIINGSPRGVKSNSTLLAEKFLEGYESVNKESLGQLRIVKSSETALIPEQILSATHIVMIFPLYTDAMPAVVMKFFEEVYASGVLNGKQLGFVVQSGFPEAIHSVTLEKYLQKLAKRLNAEYLGTVIKGGVEGIQIMPPSMTKKLYTNFRLLGKHFAKTGQFEPGIKETLMTPYKLSTGKVAIYKLGAKTGLTNFYWNSKLKEHNAMAKRDAKPFAD